MRLLLVVALLFALVSCQGLPSLPTLLSLNTHTFTTTYSCNGNYTTSALFLSSASQTQNTPELLVEASCGGVPAAETVTSGNNLGFIADIGAIPLTSLSCSAAIHTSKLFTEDSNSARVELIEGHTYLVANSFSSFRTFWGFTVNSVSGAQVSITYTVYLYEVVTSYNASPNFSWDAFPGSN